MPENTSSTSGLISVIIGIVIIVVAVVGLIWLSDNGAWLSRQSDLDGNLSDQETASILEELSKPVLGPDGQPVPPPTEAEVAAMLKELEADDANTPTQAEVEVMVKELEKANNR